MNIYKNPQNILRLYHPNQEVDEKELLELLHQIVGDGSDFSIFLKNNNALDKIKETYFKTLAEKNLLDIFDSCFNTYYCNKVLEELKQKNEMALVERSLLFDEFRAISRVLGTIEKKYKNDKEKYSRNKDYIKFAEKLNENQKKSEINKQKRNKCEKIECMFLEKINKEKLNLIIETQDKILENESLEFPIRQYIYRVLCCEELKQKQILNSVKNKMEIVDEKNS